MRFDILSLFPSYFSGPFDESIIRRAQESGVVEIGLADIRDYATGRHRAVDDRPYGGGPGMVMQAEPVAAAIRDHRRPGSRVIYLSPQGASLTAKRARELASEDHLILLCGHYEGIDQRVVDCEVDEEISIGDYVLTNGCLPAIVLVDAVVRFVPGVLGDERAASQDSFEDGLLDCPHYTRPELWEGRGVPEELMGGCHAVIERWRRSRALDKSLEARPDLYWKELAKRAADSELQPLVVSDLGRSRRFYRDALGFKSEGPLQLIEGVPAPGALFRHRVAQLDWVEGRLKEKGIAYEVVLLQDEQKILHLIDPDGYIWWITEE